MVVGGGNALFFQKEPQAGKLSFQMAGKSAGGILTVFLVDLFDCYPGPCSTQ